MSNSFWGVELNKRNPEVKWAPLLSNDIDSSDDEGWSHRLHVKMATLGKGVSKTEEQIVEVESRESDQDVAIRMPFVNMTSSAHNTMLTNATFSDVAHVTFRLIYGEGPIYLSGCVEGDPEYSDFSCSFEDSSDESSSSSSSSSPSDSDDGDVNGGRKVIIKTSNAKQAKKSTAKRKGSSTKSPPKRGRKTTKAEHKKGKTVKSGK